MNDNWNILQKKSEEFNINLTEIQLDQFKEYWKFLDEYNAHTNLVGNSEQNTVVVQHFIDSLSIGLLKNDLNWDTEQNIIDIGIGGGFPGIPILIANPNWKLCAVDSVGKKTKFIAQLTEVLGMTERVEIITGRAEDIAHNKAKRESFDISVSRAVSQLSTLSEYCLPFLKIGGNFISYKSKNIEEETNNAKKAITQLGGHIEKTFVYNIPNLEFTERNLIHVKKIKSSPDKYPRKAGTPKKTPL